MDRRVVALDSDYIQPLHYAETHGRPGALAAIAGPRRLLAITSTVKREVAGSPTLHAQDTMIASWIDKQKFLGNLKVYSTPAFPPGPHQGELSIFSALSKMFYDGSGGAVQVFANDRGARALFAGEPDVQTFDTQSANLASFLDGALSLREFFEISAASSPYAGPPRFEPFSGEVLNSSDGHSLRVIGNGALLVTDRFGNTYTISPAETPILVSATDTIEIAELSVGDGLLSFDPSADSGRGALIPKKIVRTFTNIIEEWLRLTWEEEGKTRELVTTPGHQFLAAHGGFREIESLLPRTSFWVLPQCRRVNIFWGKAR